MYNVHIQCTMYTYNVHVHVQCTCTCTTYNVQRTMYTYNVQCTMYMYCTMHTYNVHIQCTCTCTMYNVHVQRTMYTYMYMYSIVHLIFEKGLFPQRILIKQTKIYRKLMKWHNIVHKHWNQLKSTTYMYLQPNVQGVNYVDIHVLIISYITSGLWHLNLAMFWEYNMNLLTIQHGTMEMSYSYVLQRR